VIGGANIAYFADGAAVHAVDPVSGNAATIAPVAGWAGGLFVDATRIYWSETSGRVRAAALDGSGARTLADYGGAFHSIVADGAYAYWYDGHTNRILKTKY
jgi:hypothetical protein